METILNNNCRNGNFTSSEIIALTTNGKGKGSLGKPAYTYIEECNMERRLKRSLTDESNARPLSWGKLGEKRVFEIMPLEYSLCSNETIEHPTIECWKGSPDAKKENTVVDVKCPMTLKSFCQLVDPYKEDGVIIHPALTIEAVRANHKDGDKYYWQLVSNAVLTNSEFAELIVYVPYKDELEAIKGLAINSDANELNKYYWIVNAQPEELPHLVEESEYKNLNIIRFQVPKSDKEFLTERILTAKNYLEKAH